MFSKSNSLKEALHAEVQHGKLSMFKRLKPWHFVLIMVVAALCFWFYGRNDKPRAMNYLTEEASQGDLTVSVSATGTLKPTRAVDVGSELSGTLEAVLVRENDQVKKGQLLARLDTSKLKDAELKSQAAVIAAEAHVAQMEATLLESQTSLARMRHVYELSGGKVPAKIELDSAEASLKRAEANLKSAQAEVAQTRAALKTDQTNIRKAEIVSPVDGVVLTRKVEPGQTVAATMTTPVLFNIAEDLTQMELHVNIDEADVAHIAAGQKAVFTVAAWNDRKFPADVKRVDLGSTLTDNVVTYTAVLNVSNDDLALRPGMTASSEIVTARHTQALLIPNAALRFSPMENLPSKADAGLLSRLMPRMPRQPGNAPRKKPDGNGKTQLWVLEQGQPRAIEVKTGMSNGRYTEVLEGGLKPGMAVITEYQEMRR